jgi:hypothetical protein
MSTSVLNMHGEKNFDVSAQSFIIRSIDWGLDKCHWLSHRERLRCATDFQENWGLTCQCLSVIFFWFTRNFLFFYENNLSFVDPWRSTGIVLVIISRQYVRCNLYYKTSIRWYVRHALFNLAPRKFGYQPAGLLSPTYPFPSFPTMADERNERSR